MNKPLRASLWNVLDRVVWNSTGFMSSLRSHPPRMYKFSAGLWERFLKLPADERSEYTSDQLNEIREFFFKCSWNRVYDLIQFVVQPDGGLADYGLPEEFNKVMEREGAGYRFLGRVIVDITSQQEIEMLEAALDDDKFAPVSAHLRRSLELLADRSNPDYRNSIKESISAVESMAKIAANDPNATLGVALRALEKGGRMHQALKEGFLKLYGYTNDADGIRHAMLAEPNLTSADAKYFLMSCTSFVNYLKAQLTVER
jgi:hypothetical protein